MGGLERPGERDVEAVLAQHVRIAEAFEQKALMVVEGQALLGMRARRRLGESVEGRDALRGEPVECWRWLDRAQHEVAAGPRQCQRTRLHLLPAARKTDQPRLERVGTHAIARAERCLEHGMQAAVTRRCRKWFDGGGAGEAGVGKCLECRAVIGAAKPGASKGSKRRARLRRVVDRVADEVCRMRALQFSIESRTVEHLVPPIWFLPLGALSE